MLRDKNLVPLSRQHQHALALCVRIDRAILAGDVDLAAWQAEICQSFQQEIQFHFLAEEKELFPVAAQFSDLRELVDELKAEHASLREYFSQSAAGTMDQGTLADFGRVLSAHIRKEERQLFEGLQQRMTAEQLGVLGTALEVALRDAAEACLLPSEATRLRPLNRPESQ
jgi:hemerythrin-like domain-containing protein